MKRNILYIILAVVIVAVVITFGVLRRAQDAQTQDEEVRSAVVERGTLLVAVSASGSIEPEERLNLVFEVPGRVESVQVSVGDVVSAGDVLAQTDTHDLAFAVQQAEINLEAAQLRLDRIQNPPDEADIQVARAAVSDASAAYQAAEMNLSITEDSVAVGDAVRAARAARDDTYRFYQELQAKYDDGERFITEQMVSSAHDAYLNALGAYNRAVESAELQLTTAQNEVTRAYNGLQQAQNNLDKLLEGASDEDVQAAQLDVDAATLNLERAQNDLDKAVIVAPFDGVIAAVNITPGETAASTMPAITLLDLSTFHIDVSVDEMDVGRLALGQEAEVTLDAITDIVIPGSVSQIAPAASFDGGVVYYDVTIDLEETDAPIRADMTANATIVVEELEDVLLIPTWVVRIDGRTGQPYVDRQTSAGSTERVDVTLGVRYSGMIQVTDGLSEGDTIVWMQESIFDFE